MCIVTLNVHLCSTFHFGVQCAIFVSVIWDAEKKLLDRYFLALSLSLLQPGNIDEASDFGERYFWKIIRKFNKQKVFSNTV